MKLTILVVALLIIGAFFAGTKYQPEFISNDDVTGVENKIASATDISGEAVSKIKNDLPKDNSQDIKDKFVACTADAKICPDGSAVGRVGANCEFATCPTLANGVEIYKGISFPTETTAVDLSGRQLSGSLKAEVKNLKNLTALDLSDNKFTGLPAEVGQLSKLQILNLANNQFTGLPHELGNLKNLKILDVRGNNVSVPDLDIIRSKLAPQTIIYVN